MGCRQGVGLRFIRANAKLTHQSEKSETMTDITQLWHYERPAVATKLAERLAGHERIAMFGPRQTGKTTLLRCEVAPALAAKGLLPLYIECWADRSDPMAAINHALQKAIDAIVLAPESRARRIAKTPVRKLGALGASVEFGELPKRALPESPTLRFDALLTQLLQEAGQDLVLLFDEFQSIAEAPHSDTIAAGLRAALAQAGDRVGVVFSGSSPHQLLGLFTTSKAPLYSFANTSSYPLLREDFVGHVAAKFKTATRRDLNQVLALRLLEKLGHQPAPFLQVVSIMMSSPELSMDEAEGMLLSPQGESPWCVAWRGLTPLQRAVLRQLSIGGGPTSAASLAAVGKAMGTKRVAASSVDRALGSLKTAGLVDKDPRWQIIDPVMQAWLQANPTLSANDEPGF